MKLNKIIKIFLWILSISIPIQLLLFYNIGKNAQKLIESGNANPTSFEGLGIMSFLFLFFLGYLILFILWLILLKISKNRVENNSKLTQLIVIFIFSIIPAILIDGFLIRSSPSPFQQYPKVKRLEHEIQNGELIRYSADSVKLYEAYIVNDKVVGKEIKRYETGELKSVQNYKDGVLDGECIYYYKNGNKSESKVYKIGQSYEIKTWYENGQLSYFYNPDSLYRYRWWDNGQLQEMYINGYFKNFWEKDGTQTMSEGTGKVTFWYDSNLKQKSSETIYKRSQIVKQITWYLNGIKRSQDEYIQLSKQESEKIGYDCEFKGFKKMFFYEYGTIERITYWSANDKCKNNNGYSNITYEYTKEGKLKNVH